MIDVPTLIKTLKHRAEVGVGLSLMVTRAEVLALCEANEHLWTLVKQLTERAELLEQERDWAANDDRGVL